MNNFIFKKYVQFIERNGYFPMMFQPYNCSEITNISPTLTASCGSKTSSAAVLIANLGDGEMNKPGIIVLGNYSPSGHDASRIVDDNGVAPTVKENHGTVTAVATEERSMNNEPFIVASRGRNPENPSDRTTGSPTEQRLEPNTKGLCNTLTTVQKDNYVAEPKQSNLRIRKLTPKECFRLMGFDDDDFYKAEAVNSNTQLYKQAGNSIVVDVLEAVFANLKPYLSERK